MLDLQKLIFGFVLMAYASGIPFRRNVAEGEPIEPCETEGQRKADTKSCTRYHVCHKVNGTVANEFYTKIAICHPTKVYDIITESCVPYMKNKFLQDPKRCTTFYGCEPTRETSEGYLRKLYECPGDLRFHPDAARKYCTFLTNVPDHLCNSQDNHRIIAGILDKDDLLDLQMQENKVEEENATSQPFAVGGVRRPTGGILTRFSIPSSSDSGNKDTSNVNRSPTNLNRIAQVISGQLFNLRKENEKKSDKVQSKVGEIEI